MAGDPPPWYNLVVPDTIQRAMRHGSGQRVIAFCSSASPAHEPQFVVAVPVLRGSEMTGFLCAGLAPAEMDGLLADGANENGSIVFALDSAGNAVLGSKAAKDLLRGGSFFDSQALDGETAEQVLSNMQAGASGRFFLPGSAPAYAAYMPLDFEDWYLFALLPAAQMEAEHTRSLAPLRETVISQSILYTVAMALLLAAGACGMLQGIRASRQRKAEKARYAEVLHMARQSMFNYAYRSGRLSAVGSLLDELDLRPLPHGETDISGWMELHPEIDHDALFRKIEEVKLARKPDEVVLRVERENGQRRWLQVILVPQYDDQGITNLCGITTDITQRQEVFQNSVRLREELDLALSPAAALTASVNLTQADYLLLSIQAAAKGRIPPQGSYNDLAAICRSFLPEADWEQLQQTFSIENMLAVMGTGEEGLTFAHTRLDSYGNRHRCLTRAVFRRYADLEDLYAVVSCRDSAEGGEETRTIQAVCQFVTNHTPGYMGIWVFKGQDVLLLTANKNYLSFWETAPEEAYGSSVLTGLTGTEKTDILQKLYAAERRKEDIQLTFRAVKPGGTVCWVSVQASYYQSYNGFPVYISMLTDLTDLVSLQQKELDEPEKGPYDPADRQKMAPLGGSSAEEGSHPPIFCRTFGYFDIFVGDKPIHFSSKKGKELLAILVDRQGGTLTSGEAIGLLWENEPAGETQLARYRRLLARLKDTLEEAGIGDILISRRGVRSIDTGKLTCDYWEALNGNEQYIRAFQGLYMANYSWGEETTSYLEQKFGGA